MTNDNYTQMSNEEILDKVKTINKKPNVLQAFIVKTMPDLWNEIKSRTEFLGEKNISILTRLYCLEHYLQEVPKCKNPNCPSHSKVKWDKSKHKFNDFCSVKCSVNSEQTRERCRQTCLKNFNSENPFQSKIIQDKIRCKMVELYGVEHALQSEVFRYKAEQTSIKNNGTRNPFQSKKVRDKAKATLKKNHNVENPMQLESAKEKFNKTMQDRHGVDWAMQSKTIQEKAKAKNIKNLGVPFPMMSQQVKEKAIARCQELWGVDNYVQTYEYHKTSHKKYTNPKYPDMEFATSWEFKVYDFLTEHNIPFEYQPSISIPYEYDGKQHTYHPDFRVGDRIVEVKGDQFFRINESTGQEEMFNPYREQEWSDERYEWECGKYEAKHQCMLRNNVVIIRGKQVNTLEQVFNIQKLTKNENDIERRGKKQIEA